MRHVVIGGSGTVGSRVCSVLRNMGQEVWAASRSASRRLEWRDPSTWHEAVAGAQAMYLLLPDRMFLPEGFLEQAYRAGVRRVVVQSDRYADLMRVDPLIDLERQVKASNLDWYILRPGWFHQDLATFFRQPLLDGLLRVPVGDTAQSWVDARDIAAVGAAAMQSSSWSGETLVVTGPLPVSMPQAVEAISAATGREIHFDGTHSAGYIHELTASGMTPEEVAVTIENFDRLAKHGDSAPTGTVESVTGSLPISLLDYVAEEAAMGTWG